jgi:UDPglucose 6-dehydrogenase
MNNLQRQRFALDIVHTMFDNLLNKSIAIFGFAFKADTGDTRESSAIYICEMLIAEGANLNILDPKAKSEHIFFEPSYLNPEITRDIFNKKVKVFHDRPDECAAGTHAIVVLTE